ncbi:MAG: NADH-quinone oxidoreductase subunit NuoF [Thermoanaerobaculia bacterium]|nr:MAG: NADH-quinone oxidoreductase subunit NuoF [Thermoanaerobaculia bacterium]
MAFERVLTRNVGRPEARTVRGYRESGGYGALGRALKMEPGEIIEEVKKSGLRGRGGAGFPCGAKWSFVPRGGDLPKYIVCNADESEPGTFKDRLLMEQDPHQLIEGCVIAGWAVGANTTYIYIRGEYTYAARVLEEAIRDAYDQGVLGSSVLGSGFRHDVYVHRGAGAYICGEETGLLESLEGKRGQPRVKPPFPAVVGAFGAPTVINNVETLCCVTHIVQRGADWFRAIGPDERNTGPKLYAISGHVERPGTYEYPIGVTFQELLDGCGGMYKGRALKAFIPGGASAPMLTAAERDIVMDFDTLAKAGSMLGSAAVIVMDETTCVVRAALRLARFFAHESCGQCTPCREGTNWMRLVLERIESGRGSEADLDLLAHVVPNVGGISLCALGDAAQGPVRSLIAKFGDEIRDNLRHRRYPLPRVPFFDLGAVA